VFFRPPGDGDSTLAAYVTGQAGALTSAPCSPEAWTYDDQATDGFMWLTAAGIAPEYAWWTAAGSGSELAAGSGPANYLYVDGYGSGAAVPAAASPLGDTVAERIERLLQAGGAVTPSRCIDPADAAVVAALDTGGQVSGSAVSAITQSDGGLLYVDNPGALCYWQRPHLAAQPVLWTLGPDIQAGMIPFTKDTSFDTDPQRIINDIAITQYDVTAAQAAQEAGLSTGSAELRGGLVFAPDASRDAAILASQEQNGDSTLAFTSYLQSQPLIQAAANYLFDNYGQPSQRVTGITVDAAAMARTCPAAWQFVLGCNVGDVFYAVQAEPGQPAVAGTWRITRIERTISFAEGTAAATITGDLYIPYEWPGPAPDLLEDEALADILSEVGSWLS